VTYRVLGPRCRETNRRRLRLRCPDYVLHRMAEIDSKEDPDYMLYRTAETERKDYCQNTSGKFNASGWTSSPLLSSPLLIPGLVLDFCRGSPGGGGRESLTAPGAQSVFDPFAPAVLGSRCAHSMVYPSSTCCHVEQSHACVDAMACVCIQSG
jgi:hypothetical protein